MTGPTIEGEITFSFELETAFERLLRVIDNPAFIIDEELYIALFQLPFTYSWPSITIDLRPYLPFLERHLVAHLLSSRCGPLPVDVPAHTILDAWLKLLSEAIVHGIFDLRHAAYTPPPLPGLLISSRFWHAHLNHACTRATSPLAGAGTTDSIRSDCEDAIADDFLDVGVKVARYTLVCVSGKNSNLDPSFGGLREVVSSSQERGQVGHGCVYIIQVERRFNKLREGNLKYMVILWWQSRSGRFADFRIQNPRLLRSGGGRRWK